jgi:hypothetical protein
MTAEKRRGVAAVVGMLFLVFVFMIAIGAQLYVASVESQGAQSAAQAQLIVSQKSDEGLGFSSSGGTLTATDTGPSGERLVGMILKFENGTSYLLDGASSPQFSSTTLQPAGGVSVQQMVPTGVCTPGTATCLSKFNSIVTGQAVAGRGVGLLSSLGNTFWYVPSAAEENSGGSYYVTTSAQSTASAGFVAVSGLSFTGTPYTLYIVQVGVVYYQSSSGNPVAAFAISVPAGATFMFCGGLYWDNPSQGTTAFPPGNLCTGVVNTTLGPTMNTQTYCVQTTLMCEFVGTAYVSFGGTAGAFQFEFKGAATDTVTVAADSGLSVVQGA